MLEYFATHWYLVVIFIVLAVLTIFLWVKAMASSSARNKEKKEFLAKLEREKGLRQRFSEITTEVLEKEPLEDIFEGVVANIQKRIDKTEEENTISFFNSLPVPMKYVYTAFYVFDDSKDGLHEFFKKNGAPIAPMAADAVTAIFGKEVGDVVREQWEIFDEENDEKSAIPEEFEVVNKKFKNITQNLHIAEMVKDYVTQNIGEFA